MHSENECRVTRRTLEGHDPGGLRDTRCKGYLPCARREGGQSGKADPFHKKRELWVKTRPGTSLKCSGRSLESCNISPCSLSLSLSLSLENTLKLHLLSRIAGFGARACAISQRIGSFQRVPLHVVDSVGKPLNSFWLVYDPFWEFGAMCNNRVMIPVFKATRNWVFREESLRNRL
jgi:hypothetical protein